MIVKINTWPESQMCIGCKQGALVNDTAKYGPAAYICDLAMSPDGVGEEGCSEYDGQEIEQKENQ